VPSKEHLAGVNVWLVSLAGCGVARHVGVDWPGGAWAGQVRSVGKAWLGQSAWLGLVRLGRESRLGVAEENRSGYTGIIWPAPEWDVRDPGVRKLPHSGPA
jgi:hypothetical protein